MSKRTSNKFDFGPGRWRPRKADIGGTITPVEAEPGRMPDPALDTVKVALARLAEGVWRIERRARREEAADWIKPLLERVNEDLRDLGVEIIDRTGTPYRDGETLEKLHNEASDDWAGALIVTEVISPTIRIGGVLVEHGKVVVGPALNNARDETAEETTCQAT